MKSNAFRKLVWSQPGQGLGIQCSAEHFIEGAHTCMFGWEFSVGQFSPRNSLPIVRGCANKPEHMGKAGVNEDTGETTALTGIADCVFKRGSQRRVGWVLCMYSSHHCVLAWFQPGFSQSHRHLHTSISALPHICFFFLCVCVCSKSIILAGMLPRCEYAPRCIFAIWALLLTCNPCGKGSHVASHLAPPQVF